MHRLRLASLPTAFLAGALSASLLAGLPALADIVAGDQQPGVFDGASPLLTVQAATFPLGQSISPESADCNNYISVPVKLAWNAQDSGSGAASYDVAKNLAEVGDVEAASHITATTYSWSATNFDNGHCGGSDDSPNYLWIIARDYRGSTATSPAISDRLDLWDEDSDVLTSRTGTWSTSNCSCHNHGRTMYSTSRGSSLTYTIDVNTPGRVLALVAPTGDSRGVMNVSVDGGAASAVNTYLSSSTNVNRVIVWQKPLNAGRHTVRVVNAGTSGHPRVDVDALILGPGWDHEVGRWYQDTW